MDFHLDALLNLPNITVFSYASELDFIILKLQLISDGIDCPNCHHYTDTLHQVRPIYERVKELTVKQVSDHEKMSEDAVQDIFHKIAKSKKKDWGLPKRLSLDEFARKKGQGNFATIVTDLDKSSLLEVVDSHKSDDIITVLKQQPQVMREKAMGSRILTP